MKFFSFVSFKVKKDFHNTELCIMEGGVKMYLIVDTHTHLTYLPCITYTGYLTQVKYCYRNSIFVICFVMFTQWYFI
jgi:hypothetical protein